ncbi:hypothetical protein SAMN05428967_3932 [Phyllobacterium sp. YR620]|nr:hypothetical protein SAMN05428967_3932 [Phyllobacterium sp. YR620]SFJ27581.1 hypothetical protein SAMN04515648_3373 [Phyllobacterium sp. CL33Tsu]
MQQEVGAMKYDLSATNLCYPAADPMGFASEIVS